MKPGFSTTVSEARAKYPENPEERKAYFRARYATTRAYRAAWCVKHRAELRAAAQAWRDAHPELARAKYLRRHARRRGAPIRDLTAAQWQAIKDHFDHCCVYCGRHMQRLTQDHIIPLSKGGSHTMSNIVPACQSCNSRKGNREVVCPVEPLLRLPED